MSDSKSTFVEWHPSAGRGLGFQVVRKLADERSPYQHIEIFETADGGRLFTLDGIVMLSTVDEWSYHEMLVHPPLFAHPAPRRVLVIGGGDGGTAREALRHPSVERVDLVDIDQAVFDAAEKHLPETAAAFSDPRLAKHAVDGAKFMADSAEPWDVVLVDSTDPIGPGEVLFSREFYASIERALGPGGIMACQSESPFADAAIIQRVHRNLAGLYPTQRLYLGSVPFYPSGLWSYTLVCKTAEGDGFDAAVPRREAPADWGLRYYAADVHRAAFVLPPFVRALLG